MFCPFKARQYIISVHEAHERYKRPLQHQIAEGLPVSRVINKDGTIRCLSKGHTIFLSYRCFNIIHPFVVHLVICISSKRRKKQEILCSDLSIDACFTHFGCIKQYQTFLVVNQPPWWHPCWLYHHCWCPQPPRWIAAEVRSHG